MNELLRLFIATMIVGGVTSGLKIKFDRFFAIILLFLMLNKTIYASIGIFLWVILFGATYILLQNISKIADMPKKELLKMLIMIPAITAIATFIGSYLYSIASVKILTLFLGSLAIIYGLRLIFIHFKEHELNYSNSNKGFQLLCAVFGPILSGLSIGFIGTSLKPLKIPFSVKLGKMNIQKVYLGNTMIAFFASLFAIIWHNSFFIIAGSNLLTTLLYGATFWTLTHYFSEITDLFFKDSWRKNFQIIIGVFLLVVAIKLF